MPCKMMAEERTSALCIAAKFWGNGTVVLAKFFALFPEASPMARRRLRRWLWRASLDGALGGASGTHE